MHPLSNVMYIKNLNLKFYYWFKMVDYGPELDHSQYSSYEIIVLMISSSATEKNTILGVLSWWSDERECHVLLHFGVFKNSASSHFL